MTTELLTDPGHSRADLATVRRAIREGWDIPEQLLSALPKIAGAMALNAKEKSPVRLKAIATIIKMKEANDRQCNVNTVDTQRNRILELIEQRGTGGSDIATEPRGSGIVT